MPPEQLTPASQIQFVISVLYKFIYLLPIYKALKACNFQFSHYDLILMNYYIFKCLCHFTPRKPTMDTVSCWLVKRDLKHSYILMRTSSLFSSLHHGVHIVRRSSQFGKGWRRHYMNVHFWLRYLYRYSLICNFCDPFIAKLHYLVRMIQFWCKKMQLNCWKWLKLYSVTNSVVCSQRMSL